MIHHPLVKLPATTDITLFLIREELKSYKLFSILQKAGFHDSCYQPHLGELILAGVGLRDERNETYEFYYRLIQKRSRKIKPGYESVTRQALKVYQALVAEKSRRKA